MGAVVSVGENVVPSFALYVERSFPPAFFVRESDVFFTVAFSVVFSAVVVSAVVVSGTVGSDVVVSSVLSDVSFSPDGSVTPLSVVPEAVSSLSFENSLKTEISAGESR